MCRLRWHRGGAIIDEAHGLISGAAIGPIEDHRLWHFFPDAQVLALGGFGTPLARLHADPALGRYAVPSSQARLLLPERAAQFAQQQLCRGMVLTYGDPLVSIEWTLDCLKLARAASRFTAIITSGYFTPESLALVAPYLDGIRFDIYGFSERAYTEVAGLPHWREIFRNAAEARQRWNLHIELALRVVPGINDDAAEVAALAKWARVALGSLTPLHVLGDEAAQASIAGVIATARAHGLHFVYGPAHDQPTHCHACGDVVIVRGHGATQLTGLDEDRCAACEAPLGVRGSLFRRGVRYETAA